MKSRLQLHIGPDAVHASVVPGEPPPWVEQISYRTAEELCDAVVRAGEASRGFRRSSRVRVSIDAALVQRRQLTDLPPVSTIALRALVARGTARFFRQNGHPLVSGAAWTSDAGAPPVATAVAIDGAMAQSIVEGAGRSGLVVEDIVPERGPTDLSLLPEGERRRQVTREWRYIARLALWTGVLWLLVLTGAAVRLWFESRRVEGALAQLSEPRAALIRARQAMENATVMVEAMQSAEDHRESAARLLAQLVEVLPDSAYLEEVTVSLDGTATLSGSADQPRELVRDIEAVAGVGPVDLQPKGANEPDAWERFSLTVGPRRTP